MKTTTEFCTALKPVQPKMNNWLEAKPRTLLARLGPVVLCHTSEPGKQAVHAQSHSWGLTVAACLQRVPPSPGEVKTPNAIHSPAPTSPSCSCPHLCPPCSHHTGPLHFPTLLPSSLSWARGTPIHSLRPGSSPLTPRSIDPGAMLMHSC